jgi:hypothetical protein
LFVFEEICVDERLCIGINLILYHSKQFGINLKSVDLIIIGLNRGIGLPVQEEGETIYNSAVLQHRTLLPFEETSTKISSRLTDLPPMVQSPVERDVSLPTPNC